jgi:RimJ/RimL family protein N-acetyltransferase
VIIRTERLTLSTLSVAQWGEILAGRGPDAARGYPTEGDLVLARLIVAGDWPSDDWGPMQIRCNVDGLAIGGVGCKGAPDERGRVEIGYGLAESARGHGYATEAVDGLIDRLIDKGVVEVVAECQADNAPSIAVLRRCGFIEVARQGRLRRPAGQDRGGPAIHWRRRLSDR